VASWIAGGMKPLLGHIYDVPKGA